MGNRYLDAAHQGKNSGWRYLLGIVLTILGWQVLGLIPFILALAIAVATGRLSPEQLNEGNLLSSLDPLWSYVLLNLMFWFFLASVIGVVQVIHRRNWRTLVSPSATIDYGRIVQGFAVWFGLMAVSTLCEYLLNPDAYRLTFDPQQWLVLLPIALVLTSIQAATEELFFRGYLLQGLGLLTRQPIVLMLISGILFAVPHFLNPEMAVNFALLALNYFAFGVFLTWFTLKDERLELAIGMHVANNLFIALLVNYENSVLSTPAIVTANTLNPMFSLLSYLTISALFYYWFFGRRQPQP